MEVTVTRKFITADGKVLDHLPPDLLKKFQQKVIDCLTPLAYEQVVREGGKEGELPERVPGRGEVQAL